MRTTRRRWSPRSPPAASRSSMRIDGWGDSGLMRALIQNETLKILRRRRFAVVIGILLAILAVVTYSQYRQLRFHANRNWRAEIQQRIAGYQNTVRRGRINETWARSLRAE